MFKSKTLIIIFSDLSLVSLQAMDPADPMEIDTKLKIVEIFNDSNFPYLESYKAELSDGNHIKAWKYLANGITACYRCIRTEGESKSERDDINYFGTLKQAYLEQLKSESGKNVRKRKLDDSENTQEDQVHLIKKNHTA